MNKRFFIDLPKVLSELPIPANEKTHCYKANEILIKNYVHNECLELESCLFADRYDWESAFIGILNDIRHMFEEFDVLPYLHETSEDYQQRRLKNICVPYFQGLFLCLEGLEASANRLGLMETGKDTIQFIKPSARVGNGKKIADSLASYFFYFATPVVQTAAGSHRRPQEAKKPSFRSIIQYTDKEGLLKRLHELIDDETSSAMVGAILLRASAAFEGLIMRMPTQREFDEEFPKFKYNNWQSIHNYTNQKSLKALDKANKVVIFDKV